MNRGTRPDLYSRNANSTLTLQANKLTLTGTVSATGSGDVVNVLPTGSQTMGLGTGAGTLSLTQATLNQITDPERILFPMRRVGPRGGGEWQRVSWDAALNICRR